MTRQPFTPLVPRQGGRSDPVPASAAVPELLARIEAHPLDKQGAEFPFSDRLAQDNGWPLAFARRVIDEYKRFVYLACVADEEVTPSDEVDQAWHLHLAYTRDYWDAFCPNVLGRPLHHGPTEGGGAERERYEANYRRTLELYERTFGPRPPPDIWPPASIHFDYAPANVRVNTRLFAIVPKPKPMGSRTAWIGLAAGAAVAAAFGLAQYSSPAPGIAGLLVALAVYVALPGAVLWALAPAFSRFWRVLRSGPRDITQTQHGYTVTFTLGVVAGAAASDAAVTGVHVSADGSGDSGSAGGEGGAGGGCGGGGCGGGGCGGS